MRTAIDTNVLSALLSGEPTSSNIAAALADAKTEGGLAIAGPVFSELLAHPQATESFLSEFFADTGITFEFDLNSSSLRSVAIG